MARARVEKNGVDECGGRTEVVARIEETIEIGGGEFGLGSEDVTQVTPGRNCRLASGLDFFVCGGAAYFFGEGHGDGFCINEAVR